MTMKSSVVVCVLLSVILSVRAASVYPSVEAVTSITATMTTPYITMNSTPYFTSDTTTYTAPDITTNLYTQTLPSLSQIMCPDGWQVFHGRCYYFVNEDMTWSQAQTNCAVLESMLVSVHSAQEYGFLQQLTNNNANQAAWLGGFYLQDQWLWIDGSWFYNNSWSIELSDSSNPCLMLNSYEGWSNSPCNAGGYSSICEKNSNVLQAMVCPEGWMEFQGRCYFYNNDYLTWPEADTNCAGLQASLVSVHSPQEYFFLYQQTIANGSPTWLGGFYLMDQWMWLDGSWFYEGFFTQMSEDSACPCLSTYSADGWSNNDCDQSFPSFCVKIEVV
ncbi:hypothetical protein PAMP_020426 [Pampus punctatissimus]